MNAETALYGLIGHPVKHSLSPAMHNALFERHGINAVYLAFDVPPENLKATLEGLRFLSRGFNVTMPHKTAVAELVDSLSKDSEELESVNTVINRNGKLVGYTTDGLGARRALERAIELGGRKVLVIGAGGAGRAIAYELAKDNEVVVLNRTLEKAKLLERFGVSGERLNGENLKKYVRWAEIVVNATSVGMNEERSVIPPELLAGDKVVMDIVYHPLRTLLLRSAEERGCKTVDGLWMLVHQAVESFHLWTGITPDAEFMRRVALEGLGE